LISGVVPSYGSIEWKDYDEETSLKICPINTYPNDLSTVS